MPATGPPVPAAPPVLVTAPPEPPVLTEPPAPVRPPVPAPEPPTALPPMPPVPERPKQKTETFSVEVHRPSETLTVTICGPALAHRYEVWDALASLKEPAPAVQE